MSAGSSAPGASPARIPILYIGGWGRSGSTLLARMLAQVPGVVAVGELRDIWLRGSVENRLCGCGAPFRECPFWEAVGREAFGGWDRVDARRMLDLRSKVDRPWTFPLEASGKGSASYRRQADQLVAALGSLYGAIKRVSGAEVIVDSSKIPSYALLLRRIPEVDLHVIHLVRDARGVVYSWRKQVAKTDRPGRPDAMLRYGVVAASARYVTYNAQTHALRRLGTPYLLLRYEDLVADPDRYVRRILDGLSLVPDAGSLAFIEDHSVTLVPSHTVDGNPMRFAAGSVALRLDEEWRRSMPALDRALVSALTSPMLARYGYLTGRRAT